MKFTIKCFTINDLVSWNIENGTTIYILPKSKKSVNFIKNTMKYSQKTKQQSCLKFGFAVNYMVLFDYHS